MSSAHSAIRLIVGLGNPGEKYVNTRHNAGAWFVEQLATEWGIKLLVETKFHGKAAPFSFQGQRGWLLLPTTFMNASGQSVRAFSQFYQIPPEAILVAHDELDFPAGTIRFKEQGGHGGHNGLRDIMQHLSTDRFNRLRIGIGHPGQRSEVLNYVLAPPSKQDKCLITEAIQQSFSILPELVTGDIQQAIQKLHTPL
ncbi:MAG TPA: aminoacyl-tRNA hydrolase [Gammaproteobacteria bacterium]|nr:aminoacyl-tRNA hydrolase [Gammaproteobacteria bacterium]